VLVKRYLSQSSYAIYCITPTEREILDDGTSGKTFASGAGGIGLKSRYGEINLN